MIMNTNELSTQLLYTTVPIYAQNRDGTFSSGTGFIFSVTEKENLSIPLLITNYHVLENCANGFFELHISENGEPSKKSFRVQFDEGIIKGNKLGELDLIAIPLAGTLNQFQANGISLFFRTVDPHLIPPDNEWNELAAIEDIIFIGYPSGLYDNTNKTPLARRGITATPIWNDFKGNESFLVDAGVFPGSSGSPVFIYNRGTYPTKDGISVGNRIMFVGIMSQTLKEKNGLNDYLNLGVVINSKAFYNELNAFLKKLKEQ